MTVRWERGEWIRLEKEVYIYRREGGILVGRYRGFVNWKTRQVRVYPDKVLCKGWQFPGIEMINNENIAGM